jgi:hypothetical protein
MKNKNFYELDINTCELAAFNYQKLFYSLAISKQETPNSYLEVDKIPELISLHKLYPFFNDEISIFKVDGKHSDNSKWPIHIDSGRRSALNIPLINCDVKSITSFYEKPKLFKNNLVPIEEYHISIVTGDLNIIEEFNLLKPTIINTSTPHSVKNNGTGYRIIMSWGSMLNFNELVNRIVGD